MTYPTTPPLAWLLTFSTYGSWLHGDARGSRDRFHNTPGTPGVPANPNWVLYRQGLMTQPGFVLDQRARAVVTHAIEEVCRHRQWFLHALNVRMTHAHSVVSGDRPPDRILIDFKAYATRALIQAKMIAPGAKVWARHGSTRGLYSAKAVQAAIHYVVEGQGGADGTMNADLESALASEFGNASVR